MNLKLVGKYSYSNPDIHLIDLDTNKEFTRIRSIKIDLTVSNLPILYLEVLPENLEVDITLDDVDLVPS